MAALWPRAQAGSSVKTQYTLADLQPWVSHLDVACSRCDRRGRLNVAKLIGQHGAGATLRDAVSDINADCPRRDVHTVMERCDIYFPGLCVLLRPGG